MPETFLHGVEIVEVGTGPRPIRTARSGVIGIVGTAPNADPKVFPVNTPVLVSGNRTLAAKLDMSADDAETDPGTLPAALDGIFDQIGAVVAVIRVEAGADETTTQANVIGGVDANTGQYQGVHALMASESTIGVQPRILIAPGFTHQRPDDPDNEGQQLANPVVSELLEIAEQMRAVIIADGPNKNDAAAKLYAKDFGSARVYLVDPWVQVMNAAGDIVHEPASARVAGLIAKSDNDRGFWWSPSNQTISGIVGTTRAVDFQLGNANSRANLLNEANVATIVHQNGYRLWGNRTLSDDAKFSFLQARRTADLINDSLQQAHLWAVDRNITATYVEDVTEGVNAYLRQLKAQGAILGGECWPDPDLNNAAAMADGKVYFNFDFTPPYPAEHITFRSQLVDDYASEVFPDQS